MHVYVKVTNDKFEHIIAIGDTAGELAEQLGVKEASIRAAIVHARERGIWCCYRKIEIPNEDDYEV